MKTTKQIIKFGFTPINENSFRKGVKDHGKQLFIAGHVGDVIETRNRQTNEVTVTANVMAQTKINTKYKISISLDENRNITNSRCECKAGLSGCCKHISAVVFYINSEDSSSSKTSHAQQWGKPGSKQLLNYDKISKIENLVKKRKPALRPTETMKLQPRVFCSKELEDYNLIDVPLHIMVKLSEKNSEDLIAAETSINVARETVKVKIKRRAESVVTDILNLQHYSVNVHVPVKLSDAAAEFYKKHILCDRKKAMEIALETVDQSKNDEWFKQRILRISATTAHTLKANFRRSIDDVVESILHPSRVETPDMKYGKKMECTALNKYKEYLLPTCGVASVGLIVKLSQPWLCCSPDAFVTYGPNIYNKRIVEIKSPAKCKKIPVVDRQQKICNVTYLKFDENGNLYLNPSSQIYTQVQMLLYVTNIPVCDLFVYSPEGSELLMINRNCSFLTNAVSKITLFYFNHYLPKLMLSPYFRHDKEKEIIEKKLYSE